MNEHSEPSEQRGRIVTFYSYKGGTGRTMSLANVAWILASNGQRVLAVDWDLESPGLHRYFHPFLLDKQLRSTPGLIDLIRNFAAATMEPGGADPTWYREHANILDVATSLDWEFAKPGTLDFVSPGKQDSSYSTAVSTFDWGSFYERQGGGAFLDALADDMRRQYDWILIDSRTGLSDTSGICTVQLPDVVVNCFTLSTQSLDGAAAVASTIRSRRTDRPVRILPVPMRVEDGEQTKLEAGRDYARARFDSFLTELDAAGRERYWGDVEIPYKPFYAYEEIPAPVGDRPRQEGTLLAACERLVRELTDGAVTEVVAFTEPDRRRCLAEYERLKPPVPSDVFISYAPEDRMWAEWMDTHLTEAGFRVIRQGTGSRAGADYVAEMERTLTGAARTLVLVSSDYVRYPYAQETWQAVVARDPSGAQRLVVPVRVSDVRLPPPFTDRTAVDLVGLSEERALDELLAAAGRPAYSAGRRQQPAAVNAHATRFPGAVPPVWSVPTRNAAFTGRGQVLEQLRDGLASGMTVVLPQALFGMGGVGKTQIAIEYAHRFAADYDVVWWVSAEQPAMTRAALAEMAPDLGVPSGDSVAETAAAVLDALRRGQPYRRWLLVFDNAEDPDELAPFIAQGTGHVLVTSRNQDWAKQFDHVEVDVFGREESVTLLTRRCPTLDPLDADRIAEALGDLPLAVWQASAWLDTTGMSAETYLQLLSTEITRLLAESTPAGYPTSAAATWLVSVDRLRTQMPAAAKLLQLCAFFAPEPIPLSLLYGDKVVSLLAPYDPSLRDPILLGRLVREIGRYALARVDQGQSSIQIHRLVQAVLRDQMSAEEQAETRHHVHEVLAAANPRDTDVPENWRRYAELLPHLRPSESIDCSADGTRQLVADEARYLWRRGDFTSSQDLAERARTKWRERFGEDDPWTLLLGFHLANALRAGAAHAAAYNLDTDVLERMRRTLGDNHPYTLMASGNLAADMRTLGNYRRAREIDEDTLTRFQEVFGDDHPRTLMVANNLAESLLLAGQPAAARTLHQDTLERSRQVRGVNHPSTLFAANNLARDLRETGAFQASCTMLQDTLTRYQESVGEDHPATLRASKNLAVSLRKLGQFAAARTLNAEALPRFRRLLGNDHPDTLACAVNLACDMFAVGETRTALELSEDMLGRYQRVLGDEHPFTLACANNLAVFLRANGDGVRARTTAEQTLASLRAVLGDDHPYALACAVNLANNLYDLGDREQASALDDETYERYRRVLGPDHPETLACGSNLSISLRAAGQTDRARTVHDEVLRRSRDVLGDNHANTIRMIDGQRLNCDIEAPPT